jgi:hypothetical protein
MTVMYRFMSEPFKPGSEAKTPDEGRRRTRGLRIPQPLHQCLNRRRLEQAADRKLNIQRRTDPADQPRRQQRMTPERKEVVVQRPRERGFLTAVRASRGRAASASRSNCRGTPSVVLSTFLPPYALRYPDVQVKLIEAVADEALAMVERGEIHLSISMLDAVEADQRRAD